MCRDSGPGLRSLCSLDREAYRPGGFENCCAYGLVTENVRCTDESSVSCIVHDAQHVGELKAPPDNMRGDGAVAGDAVAVGTAPL